MQSPYKIKALQNFRTYALAQDFYRDCQLLGLKDDHLRNQLKRASQGILLTLAEGSAKPSAKDRARFYSMALGSFRECQCILQIADQATTLTKHDALGGCLYKLSRLTG